MTSALFEIEGSGYECRMQRAGTSTASFGPNASPSETVDSRADTAPESEIDLLRRALEQAQLSASIQCLRAQAQAGDAHDLRQQVTALRGSLFWRATLPLRVGVDLLRGAPETGSPEARLVRRGLGLVRREGVGAAWRKTRAFLKRRSPRAATPQGPAGATPPGIGSPPSPTPPSPNAVLRPSVLIVAELTLPQCAKYRVWQKQEHFTRLGRHCRVIDWRQTEDCIAAAALATSAILYRVPAYRDVQRLYARLHELGVPVAWEVDDLIFDRALYLDNRNIDDLDPDLREGILSGVTLYRDAMLAADFGIASTEHLASAMRQAGVADVIVIENALDAETLELAEQLQATRQPDESSVSIIYGSGTKTHDADFREASEALLQVMEERPHVALKIVGHLNLPEDFDRFRDRVRRIPALPYGQYLAQLAASDISIAPLEPTLFNDAKSNIKFLEASIVGVSSICSPRANFASLVEHGATGFLADGTDSWKQALLALIDDASLRQRVGTRARASVLSRYAPQAVAEAQVVPLIARTPDRRRPSALRVLFANVYFAPQSYGGATLVVEEMARRLSRRGDVDVHVAAALPDDAPSRTIQRTDEDGVTVFRLPVANDVIAEFDDPATGEAFGHVLDAVQPDVVHLHSIQWLSASITAACRRRFIPYVITVHDAWWLCARQFMVREDGRYCFQERIDLRVCEACVHGARHLETRTRLLRNALEGAALLLSPSESHRQLYIANGIDPARIAVHGNGVRLPAPGYTRKPGKRIRFAYVGGNVEVKGFSIVKAAYEALARDDWELTLVDNTLNLGFSTVDAATWKTSGHIQVVPAYTQDAMDDFYSAVDVLLFPSQWKESFGLTVREALARHVWVIASDGGGPAEAIRPGVNGTLVPLDAGPGRWRDAVEAILDRPDRLAGYRNPYAGDIEDHARQAEALHGILRGVARDHGTARS